MIPIKDHNKTPTTPFVTYLLIAINILVFFFTFSLGSLEFENFIYSYALIPMEIANSENLHTLITSMFLHGGLGHIFSNMLFLNIFGDNLEYAFGHFFYLLFYLLSGIGASLLQIFIEPTSTIPNLGASGAIAGLLGGYLILFPNHKIDTIMSFGGLARRTTVPAYTMLIYWFLIQFVFGLGSLGNTGQGGIAYFAHLGGFITGLIIVLLTKPLLRKNLSY